MDWKGLDLEGLDQEEARKKLERVWKNLGRTWKGQEGAGRGLEEAWKAP